MKAVGGPALLPWETEPHQHESKDGARALEGLLPYRDGPPALASVQFGDGVPSLDKPLLLADHESARHASDHQAGAKGQEAAAASRGGVGRAGLKDSQARQAEGRQAGAGGSIGGAGAAGDYESSRKVGGESGAADGGTELEGQRNGEEDGDWMEKKMHEWESEWKDNPGLYEMKMDHLWAARLQEEAQRRGLALAAIREKEMEALDHADGVRKAAEVEAVSAAGVLEARVAGRGDAARVERELQREAEMYAMWPEVAGVCAKDKHPLDYEVPVERLDALARDNIFRKLARADDAQFEEMMANIEAALMRQAPKHVRQHIQQVERKFGFFPGLTDEIEGVTSYPTSLPLPLPWVAVKRGDLVVPDSFSSVPEAVWSCRDGHRLFIRAGNHTWLGTGQGGWTCDRPYDLSLVTKSDASSSYMETVHGSVMVPPGHDSVPIVDEWMAEYVDPQIDSFCLHVTGERGARVCGRWLLKANSVGSFSGIETVYQINETAFREANGALNEMLYLCTIDVRGGPWLMDKCGLRACMAVAVVCARQSLVKVRGCVVGGISHDRKHHSGAGRATMAIDCRDFARVVLQNSTAEMTGWDFMAAVRATGKVLVSILGCIFDRNVHSIGVFDHASIKVSGCVMQGNSQGAFVAYERRRPIAANPPDELFLSLRREPDGGLGKRAHDGSVLRDANSELPAVRCKKGVREGVGLHPYLRHEGYADSLECGTTIRRDPVFGNVTDGWELGLPGWTNGVPRHTTQLVEGIVGPDPSRAQLQHVPPRSLYSFFALFIGGGG